MLNPHLLLWLGFATVALASVGQALKSDTFDSFLAFFGAPALPKVWVPRVTVLVGVAAAVVTGVASGKAIEQALAEAFAVGLGGVFAIAGHEVAARKNVGLPANDDPKPRGSASPPSAMAGGMIVGVIITVVALAQGCALFQPGAKFPTDAENAAACVVGDIEKGQTNVAQILIDCRDSETAMVLDVIGTLVSSPKFATDHPEQHPQLKASYAIVRGSH